MGSRTAVLFIITTVSLSAGAQPDSVYAERPWFISIHSGTLLGWPGTGSPTTLALMSGVRHNRFALTVGAGFDQYPQWQTLPMFAGIGYDFFRRRQHVFFLHFNTGYSKAWSTLKDDESQVRHRHDGGYMFHPFLGYRVRQGKISLYFSMGYKLQTLTYKHIPIWRDQFGIVHENTGIRTTIERRIERVSVQMGIGLN